MPDQKTTILRRINEHIKKVGVPLNRIGEILGSTSKTTQGRIGFARDFLAGGSRAFSLEKVFLLEKFLGQQFSASNYSAAMNFAPALAAETGIAYGKRAVLLKKIREANDIGIEKLFADFVKEQPQLFVEIKPSSLSSDAKRLILQAYYTEK